MPDHAEILHRIGKQFSTTGFALFTVFTVDNAMSVLNSMVTYWMFLPKGTGKQFPTTGFALFTLWVVFTSGHGMKIITKINLMVRHRACIH